MNYVYSVRFQPFSNENLEILRWLIENTGSNDQIVIGIVNPNPQYIDNKDDPLNWKRFSTRFNPLSYWERYKTIELVIHSYGWQNKIAGIVPMPRPSVNMKCAENYLPPKNNRKMCVPIILRSAIEDTKTWGLRQQGETVFEIPAHSFLPDSLKIISPELITCLISLHYNGWDKFVPKAIHEYIKSPSVDIERRCFDYYEAKTELEKVYVQMPTHLQGIMKEQFGQFLNH